jgi:multidrug resistance efflux pump
LAAAIAREQLERLRAQQADYRAAVLGADIGRMQAQDALARAEIEYQKALDRHWEPQEVRDGYARALQQAQWDVETAVAQDEQALAALQVYQHDINIQELLVSQAEAALQQLRAEAHPLLALDVQRAEQQIDWLEEGVDPVMVNDVSQSELALERLQAQVAEAQIVAPVDGEVLSVSIYAGQPVEAFTPAIILADATELEVSANLVDRQLEELVEGQEASIVLSAYPGEIRRGTVRRLPYPYGSGGGTQRLAGEDKSVRISLDGDLSDLKLGDIARVTIILEHKEDVLWLPPAGIRTFQGRHFVIVKDADRQRRVDIRVGIEGVDRIEVLEGLEEGQIVIGP